MSNIESSSCHHRRLRHVVNGDEWIFGALRLTSFKKNSNNDCVDCVKTYPSPPPCFRVMFRNLCPPSHIPRIWYYNIYLSEKCNAMGYHLLNLDWNRNVCCVCFDASGASYGLKPTSQLWLFSGRLSSWSWSRLPRHRLMHKHGPWQLLFLYSPNDIMSTCKLEGILNAYTSNQDYFSACSFFQLRVPQIYSRVNIVVQFYIEDLFGTSDPLNVGYRHFIFSVRREQCPSESGSCSLI